MKKKQMCMLLVSGILAAALTACGSPEKSSAPAVSAGTDAGQNAESKPATQYTIDTNQQVYALLDLADTTELENANRGFLAAPDTLDLRDEEEPCGRRTPMPFSTRTRRTPQIPAFGGTRS